MLFNKSFDGLVQEKHDSITDTLESHLSCPNPSFCELIGKSFHHLRTETERSFRKGFRKEEAVQMQVLQEDVYDGERHQEAHESPQPTASWVSWVQGTVWTQGSSGPAYGDALRGTAIPGETGWFIVKSHFVDLMQYCSNSIVLAVELLQSCDKPLLSKITCHFCFKWVGGRLRDINVRSFILFICPYVCSSVTLLRFPHISRQTTQGIAPKISGVGKSALILAMLAQTLAL